MFLRTQQRRTPGFVYIRCCVFVCVRSSVCLCLHMAVQRPWKEWLSSEGTGKSLRWIQFSLFISTTQAVDLGFCTSSGSVSQGLFQKVIGKGSPSGGDKWLLKVNTEYMEYKLCLLTTSWWMDTNVQACMAWSLRNGRKKQSKSASPPFGKGISKLPQMGDYTMSEQ